MFVPRSFNDYDTAGHMTKLAKLISQMEGFGKVGAVPTTHNNPGDLRHSPHSKHDPGKPDGIGIIDTEQHGWEDLERQLQFYARRGMTLQQAIYAFAPPNENNSVRYLQFVCEGLGMEPSMPVSHALLMQDGDQALKVVS